MSKFNDLLLQAIKEAVRVSVKYETPEQFNDVVEVIYRRSLKLQQEAAEATIGSYE